MFNKIRNFSKKKRILSISLVIIISFGVSFFNNTLKVKGAFFTDCTETATTGISESECQVLEDLYEATDGDNWTDNTNWGTNTAVDTWKGVYTDAGNISLIILDNNNLVGFIPKEISNLTFLERLDLSNNSISSLIPSEIGNMNSLEIIYLDYNNLTGIIPTSLGNLPNLQRLYLNNNKFTGELPINSGSFSALLRLRLGYNNLTGNIPAEIGDLSNLENLYLEYNNLTGTIPTEIGNLTNLRRILLNNNDFTGLIPSEIGNLTDLDYFNISNNRFNGELPTEIGNLINLQKIDLSNNKFTGPLPNSLTNLTELIYFYIQDNSFSETIPDMTNTLLDYFSITNNSFVFADFESEFSVYNDYTYFKYKPQKQVDTERTINGIIASTLTIIPEVPANANDTYTWYLNGEKIEGYTDRIYTKQAHSEDAGVYTYQIRNNIIGGEFTPAYFLYSHDIEVEIDSVCLNPTLTISQVECEALESFYETLSEDGWMNKTNWRFSPDVNTWYGVTVEGGTVTELNLQNNNLKGIIPSIISNLPNLEVLNLSGNQLKGAIPSEIFNLTNLTTLYLYENSFEGSISENIGNLTNLIYLGLSSNDFTGNIPLSLNNISNLTQLNLSRNQLTGTIPTTLGDLVNLNELSLANNNISGTIPTELGNLINLSQLSLENNQLTGEIPSALGSLSTNLINLNLSNNQLAGEIPTELGNLVNLEYLFLNQNKLEGNIPSELLGLNNLISLYFGENNLSGDIPNFSLIATLENLTINNNNFVFSDFEDEFSAYNGLTRFSYLNQQKVDTERLIEVTEYGDILKIIPEVALNPSGNDTYQWYKDNLAINTDQAKERIYKTIADDNTEGIYKYTITNANIPDLILTSNNIKLYSGANLTLIDCSQENITGISQEECIALKDLYTSTNGENWINNTNWGKTTNIGIWQGITIENNHVIKIDLRDNNLNGVLPSSLVNFTQLEEFLLRDNILYGKIPTEIGNLVELEKIDFSGNQLGGSLPNSIGNLINLKELIISNNSLTGSIPTEIGNLVNLEILNLDRNKLSCAIPDQIRNLTELFYKLGLQIYSNNLEIPADQNSELYIFLDSVSSTGSNYFTNQNASFCNTVNLPPTSINLSKKNIDEGLPENSVVATLTATDLDTLSADLTFTLVSGDGDDDNDSFRIVNNATTIELQAINSFDFETKTSYKIRINVNDGDNNYAESFIIKINDVNDNQFLDCTTQSYISTIECESLIDFYNSLNGDNSDLNWKDEEEIKDWNNLEFEKNLETLDKDLDEVFSNVDPDDNDACVPNDQAAACLDGDLDGTPKEEDVAAGQEADPDDTDPCVPDDTVEKCTEKEATTRNVTKISGQYLRGEIPNSIKNFKYLKILKLDNNNNITGHIPVELGELLYLEHLYLANNKFVGTIPVELSNLSKLITLSLSRNKLTGTIPSELGSLSELHYLYLFDNEFSCFLPETLTNLKKLVDGDGLRIHDNRIIIPEEGTELYNFIEKKSPDGEALFSLQREPYCGEVPTDIILDSFTIDENQPIESLVGNLSTLDEDDTVFTYTLVDEVGNTDNSSFKIINSTLVSAEIFDYETKNSYLVRINTNDGENNLEKLFTISINDVNLPPTDIYLSSNIIPEQQIITTPIGKFTVEDDGESDDLTYSLVGGVGATDNASFLINGDELQANKVFDFDEQSVFSIRVNANDGAGDFSKVFIITISSDQDGDGVTDTDDINPNDACLPDANSLACLSQDRDGDNVADGADLDPNDPCIPHSASEACRDKWGPLWDLLYGDGEDPIEIEEKEELNSCGQSCRYAIKRYQGGYFTGATGNNGVFRTGDYITYIPPKGHPLETYHINYSKIGAWDIKKAYQSVQIKPGYLDHQKVTFPLHVKNGEGKQIVLLNSPEVIIDNNPAIYHDIGYVIGASGRDGAFMEGDELRYFGPQDRNEGDTFEIDLHQVGMSDFLPERYPWILNDIKSWYGKYIDIYVTVTDKSGNASEFKGPRIWFGKVIKIEDLQNDKIDKSSAKEPEKEVKKIPQKNKNPFFRPEDPYDMILKKKLEEKINRPPKPKVIEDFDLRKDLEKEFGVISKPKVIKNPFPPKKTNPKTSALKKRLLQKRQKPKKKEVERPTLREFLQGLVK